ncbi:MAG: hypothetical protein P8O05_02240, partial [Flavobacteriales bacterium]|nr:hypothetical protein [Flavobacteriales bacterium]
TAPVLTGEDEVLDLECNVLPTIIAPEVSDNCDDEIELDFNIETIDGECFGQRTEIYSWTAIDDCGNTSVRTITFNFDDTTAPNIVCPEAFTVNCDNESLDPENTGTPVVDDNCSEFTLSFEDGPESDGCPSSFARTWTAVDACGNTSNCIQNIVINDFVSPVIFCPADITVECVESLDPSNTGQATAEDDCSIPSISFSDSDITDGCPYSFERTWTALDPCGNETSCVQTITVVDTGVPEIIMPPLYYSLEWSVFNGNFIEDFLEGELDLDDLAALYPLFNEQLEAQGYFYPTATDACDTEVVPFYNQSIQGPESLDCPMVARVVWSFQASDDCGNMTDVYDVVCEFFDTTAPEFTNLPEDVTVECIEDVTGPADVNAEDACADVVSIDVFSSETGYPINECIASTAFGPGDDWAIWLPVLETDGTSPTDDFVPADLINFVQYNDGTAHVYGTVVNNSNPNQGFEIDFWFENTVNWDEWSAMGRSYKDDLGFAAAGGDLWTTWSYMEMVNGFSTLTGIGEFEGSVLYMSHMPSNYFFGFQCGEAANNKNSNFGMSGWFTYDGFINGEAVEGHGDINVDKECTPSNEQDCIHNTEFTYFYRAEDTCGNVIIDSYTETVNDTTAPEFIDFPADVIVDCQDFPVEIPTLTAEDNCAGEVIVEY